MTDTTTSTDADLDEDERVCAAATPGPWRANRAWDCPRARLEVPDGVALAEFIDVGEGSVANLDLAARARTRYPALVAEVRSLRADLAAVTADLDASRIIETVLRERVTAFAQWANGIALALDESLHTETHVNEYLTRCRALYKDAIAAEVAARIARGESA